MEKEKQTKSQAIITNRLNLIIKDKKQRISIKCKVAREKYPD